MAEFMAESAPVLSAAPFESRSGVEEAIAGVRVGFGREKCPKLGSTEKTGLLADAQIFGNISECIILGA